MDNLENGAAYGPDESKLVKNTMWDIVLNTMQVYSERFNLIY